MSVSCNLHSTLRRLCKQKEKGRKTPLPCRQQSPSSRLSPVAHLPGGKQTRHERSPRAGRPFPSPMASAGGAALAALALLGLLSVAAASDSDHKVGVPGRRVPSHASRSARSERATCASENQHPWCRAPLSLRSAWPAR